jgi:hypothetical protein
MPATLDLLILPLVRSTGLDQPVIPVLLSRALHAGLRFRDRDRLGLYLAWKGPRLYRPARSRAYLRTCLIPITGRLAR